MFKLYSVVLDAVNTSVWENVSDKTSYSCSANASGPCLYKWVKFTNTHIVTQGSELRLTDPHLVGSGVYECKAHCSIGTSWCILNPMRVNYSASFLYSGENKY